MDASRPEQHSLLRGRRDSAQHVAPVNIHRKPVPRRSATASPTAVAPDLSLQDEAEVADGHALHAKHDNEKYGDDARKFWSPMWLRKSTLLLLSISFVAFVGSLIAVWASNRAQKGFSIALSSNHYAWTYGPTAILVVVLSLWRQVDYYCKLMQPWQQLHKTPTDAEMSVLLDYVGPINITSLYKAIRRGYFAVMASITGFALLKLITLFSTGLLVLTPTPQRDIKQVTLTSTFNGDSCVPKEKVLVPLMVFPVPPLASYSDPDMQPLYAYTGVRDGQIRTPDGIDGDTVFQSFRLATDIAGINDTSVDVEIVRPNLQCETAEVKILDSQQRMFVTAFTPNVQLKTETCSLGSDLENDPWWIPAGRDVHDWELDYQWQRVECPKGAKSDPRPDSLDTNFTKDIRYAMIVSNISVESATPMDSGGFATFEDGYPSASVKQVTAIFCRFEYNTGKATLLRDLAQNSLTLGNVTAEGQWSNFTDNMLGEIVLSILLKADPQNLALKALPGNATLETLMDAEALTKAAKLVWDGVATQYLRQNCLLPAHINSTGTANLMEERLHVSLLSIWVMIAGFAALIGCAISIMYTATQDVVPRQLLQ